MTSVFARARTDAEMQIIKKRKAANLAEHKARIEARRQKVPGDARNIIDARREVVSKRQAQWLRGRGSSRSGSSSSYSSRGSRLSGGSELRGHGKGRGRGRGDRGGRSGGPARQQPTVTMGPWGKCYKPCGQGDTDGEISEAGRQAGWGTSRQDQPPVRQRSESGTGSDIELWGHQPYCDVQSCNEQALSLIHI